MHINLSLLWPRERSKDTWACLSVRSCAAIVFGSACLKAPLTAQCGCDAARFYVIHLCNGAGMYGVCVCGYLYSSAHLYVQCQGGLVGAAQSQLCTAELSWKPYTSYGLCSQGHMALVLCLRCDADKAPRAAIVLGTPRRGCSCSHCAATQAFRFAF